METGLFKLGVNKYHVQSRNNMLTRLQSCRVAVNSHFGQANPDICELGSDIKLAMLRCNSLEFCVCVIA